MATKLLLTKDVEDLGRSGDIVSVKPGYARNYLLPQGFGIVADARALRMQTRIQEERRKKALEDKKDAEACAKQLEGKEFEIVVKVDPDGHMYGSVSSVDVLALIEKGTGIVLGKKAVALKHPIKKLGTHFVRLNLNEGVETEIKVTVTAEAKLELK